MFHEPAPHRIELSHSIIINMIQKDTHNHHQTLKIQHLIHKSLKKCMKNGHFQAEYPVLLSDYLFC